MKTSKNGVDNMAYDKGKDEFEVDSKPAKYSPKL